MTQALDQARRRSDLGAFWYLTEARALEQAEAAGLSGGALAGVPFAIKDNFNVAGAPTSGGVRGLDAPASADAEAVRRLVNAGAIPIGKTSMDTLAWSTHGQADGFPPCRNPTGRDLSPGGSSAGSAVAVAAGIVPVALGSDTAGSVRIPAAYCGVVGFKSAPNPETLEGCLPLARSFDSLGVIGRSVRHCALALEALEGDPHLAFALSDSDSELAPGPVGVLVDLVELSQEEVATACRDAVTALSDAGVEIHFVRLDWWAPEIGLLLAVEFAECWGQQIEAEPGRYPRAIVDAVARTRQVRPERVKQARESLADAREWLTKRLERFAAVMSPTVPTVVPSVGEENVATSTRFTRIFSALGWAAVSVPWKPDAEGRPVGLQLSAPGTSAGIVALAALLERAAA